MANKISVIIDATVDGAVSRINKFKSAIADADGVSGKLKAGFGQATDFVKANAASLATAGGAALIAFGVKAVGAFTETAKAAINAAAATGLSVEQASRWIAVADDYGLSADQLVGGLGKIAKSLDSGKWDKYGIATRDASGEARSANDIMLDALDVLGKTTNATERARIGNELFGKGYTSLGPIVGKTRKEYEDMLSAVEDGQVITREEAEKAERWRLAQDQLADALQEVGLAVGEVVSELGPYVSKVADIIGALQDLKNTAEDQSDQNIFSNLKDSFEWFGRNIKEGNSPAEAFRKSLDGLGDTAIEAGLGVDKVAVAIDDAAVIAQTAADAEAELADTIERTNDAIQRQTDALNEQVDAARGAADANYALADATDEYTLFLAGLADKVASTNGTQSELNALYREGTIEAAKVADAVSAVAEKQSIATGKTYTATQKLDDFNKSMLASAASATGPLRTSILNYIAATNQIPAKAATEIRALIDEGKIAEAEARLKELSKTRGSTVTVSANTAQVNKDIDYAARDRTSTITVKSNAPSGHDPLSARSVGTSGSHGVVIQNLNVSSNETPKRWIDEGRWRVVG